MRQYILLVLLGLALANWVSWGYVLGKSDLKVTFFNVGQGDAIFIETPQGHQILIDGGPGRQVALRGFNKQTR
jgi:competence protein ComEC